MDAYEEVIIKTDGDYTITTTASEMTDSCIVDFVLHDEQGNVYAQNTTQSGQSQTNDVHLAAGTYIYEAVLITTDSELEQYLTKKEYDYDTKTREMYLDLLDDEEDSSRGGTLALDISMSLQ